jgi:hypothetical protein
MPRKKNKKNGPRIKNTIRSQAVSEYLSSLEQSFPVIFGVTSYVLAVLSSKGADENFWINKNTEKYAKTIVEVTLDYITRNVEQSKKVQEKKLKDSLVQLYKSEKRFLGNQDKARSDEVAAVLVNNRLPASQDNIDLILSCFKNGPGIQKLKKTDYGTGAKERAMYVAMFIMKENNVTPRAKYAQLSDENISKISRELAECLIVLDLPKSPAILEAQYRLFARLGVPKEAIELIKEKDGPSREAFMRDFIKYHQDKK